MTSMQGLAPAAGTRGVGGTSLGSLGSDEEEVRQYRLAKKKESILRDAPSRDLPSNPDGSPRCRVFRIPDKVGYRLLTDMKRRVVAASGDEVSPPSWLEIQFTPSLSEFYGELILEPELRLRNGKPDPADAERAAADKRRVEIIERWAEENPYLGIIDWLAAREAATDREAASDAARLADPNYLARVMKQAKELGVSVAESFEDFLSAPSK